MMNVVVLTYLFYPEPIVMSTITEDIAMELSKNHNVVVVSSMPCRPYGYVLPNETVKEQWQFRREMLNSYTHPKSDVVGRMRENISFGRAAVQYVRKHHSQIDVIYMNVFPLFAQQMVIEVARKYGIATVNHIEDIYPEPFKQKLGFVGTILYKFLLPKDKWNIKHATNSVVIGEKIKEYFIRTRKVKGDNIKGVYNWQDEERFNRPRKALPRDDVFTFMYVGSISRAAGLHHIIEAFADAKISNARLVFAGAGNEKESLKLECLKFGDLAIEFVDAPFDKIAELQSQADVLILPLLKGVSLRAVPSKLPAYLFSHKAILACVEEDSDVADIITKGECGWVSPPEDSKALSLLMEQVSQVPAGVLMKMGNSGFNYAQAHLTKEINLSRIVNVILESVATGK